MLIDHRQAPLRKECQKAEDRRSGNHPDFLFPAGPDDREDPRHDETDAHQAFSQFDRTDMDTVIGKVDRECKKKKEGKQNAA